MSGKLVKLKIKAYSDERFTKPIENGEFETLINPEKYVFKYKVDQNTSQAPGTSGVAPKFIRILPEDIDFEFVFDRTGIFQGNLKSKIKEGALDIGQKDGIIQDISDFKKVVINYNGNKHMPNYLVISWGTLLFKCTLSEMDITFKLFMPDGTPLRAVAKVKFKGFVEDDLRVARENNSSPDLTHVRTVKEGDTLPLMTFRIYGDAKYYLEVAKANKIQNFRKLKVGQEIFFPPIV